MQIESKEIIWYKNINPLEGCVNLSEKSDGTPNIQMLSESSGPGRRLVIKTQGCINICRGCCTDKSILEDRIGVLVTYRYILNKIRISMNSVARIEGITLLGGEPLLQAKNISELLILIRNNFSNLNILLMTGYYTEYLIKLNNLYINKILGLDGHGGLIDAYIDGPFDIEKREKYWLWGSNNQTLYLLSNRLEKKSFIKQKREEYVLGNSSTLDKIGIKQS